jgi:hypothetical protein
MTLVHAKYIWGTIDTAMTGSTQITSVNNDHCLTISVLYQAWEPHQTCNLRNKRPMRLLFDKLFSYKFNFVFELNKIYPGRQISYPDFLIGVIYCFYQMPVLIKY